MTTDRLADIAKIFTEHDSFMLVPHERADGDACGSMFALAEAMTIAGKEVHEILLSPPGPRYEFLFEDRDVPVLGEQITCGELPPVEVVVVIDTTATCQLTGLAGWFEQFSGTVVAIDHHERGDLRCHAEMVDETAPATGLLVCKLLDHMNWFRGRSIAGHLLMAIGTDTGWFSFSNVTGECFRWAGKLAGMGAPIHEIYENLFLADSPQRFRLAARTLSSAELLADGRIVVFTLTRDDFRLTGASEAHTENLIDYAAKLKTMKVAVLFVEGADGTIRISLRSRQPVNVHEFAQMFGGGGHRRAAGVRVNGPLSAIKTRILNKLTEILDGA